MDYHILFELLKRSEAPLFRMLIRRAIKCREQKRLSDYSQENAHHWCQQLLDTSRRKFVRRSYGLQPLFALSITRECYP